MKVAYVDANVVLRFLTGDPPALAGQARKLFDSVDEGTVNLVVDEIVAAETVWVLESYYGYRKQEVARVLQEFLGHDGLICEDKAGVLTALNLYAEHNIDFADALIAVHMGRRGVKELYSFDRHFDRLPDVSRQAPGNPS